MTLALDRDNAAAARSDALQVLARFGALMLSAGNTATRTREWMEALAARLGMPAIAVSLSLDSLTVSVRGNGEWATVVREIAPSRIDARQIVELEQLVQSSTVSSAAGEIAVALDGIEAPRHIYHYAQLISAIGVASGGFAFLNGGGLPEVIAAAAGGGMGQWLRHWLARRQLNQYAVAALCAVAASGTYVLAAGLGAFAGVRFPNYPSGFIASVLFLVPGFPLLAALFDLLQHHTVIALGRLAYGVMLLLAVVFGLSIVIEIAGIDLARRPPIELAYGLKALLWAVASFVAAAAFAMLFNNGVRAVVVAGLLAACANELRMVLLDSGAMLAPAALFGALAVGFGALIADARFDVPRIATTVPAIIIMVPGLYAYETIVFFNKGQMIEALQAFASCAFVIGALAMGLATARLFSRGSAA